MNGKFLLVGNNGEEGQRFVPQTISTLDDLTAWAFDLFPGLNNETWLKLLETYPDPERSNLFSSQQARANLIFGEMKNVCPSYWMAQAYPPGNAWHFQFSVPPALHGQDRDYYFPANGTPPAGREYFAREFTSAFANFIVNWDPRIPASPRMSPAIPFSGVPWPAFQDGDHDNIQLNFNVTATNVTSFSTIGDVDNLVAGVEQRCTVWRSIASIIRE